MTVNTEGTTAGFGDALSQPKLQQAFLDAREALILMTEVLTANTTGGPAENHLLELLNRYHHARRAAMLRECEAVGIDPTGAAAMHEIILAEQQHDPLTPTMLARLLGISTASGTAVIDRLTAAGLVSRAPHPIDRRKRVLHTTLGALPDLLHAKAMITTLAQNLPPDDAALIANFLNQLSTVLEAPNNYPQTASAMPGAHTTGSTPGLVDV